MKAQSEILVFILLFLLSIVLFTITVYWSRDAFQQNVDITRVSSAERFMKEMNYDIKSLMKYGGHKEIDYNVDGPIKLVDNHTIEVKTVVTSDISLPTSWNNISSDYSYISEVLDGDVFRVRLVFPEDDYSVEFFTDGPTLAKPKRVVIEENSTDIENGKATIKIRITFV
jgi:hypothetical protein